MLKPFPPTGPHLTYAFRATYNNISHSIPFSWAEGLSPFLSSCLVSYSQTYSTVSVSSFFFSFRRSSFLFTFFLLSFSSSSSHSLPFPLLFLILVSFLLSFYFPSLSSPSSHIFLLLFSSLPLFLDFSSFFPFPSSFIPFPVPLLF